ncbi:MAG: M24 family metallopeptidase [Verrucomicrobiota bacterium]|nr:M24 family metallopeptidase [Verrucomicrobiota bacterium]
MKSKSSKARFLFTSSEQSADAYYLTGVFIPDPFLCGVIRGRSFAVVNRLEYRRVKEQSKLDSVYFLETLQIEASKLLKIEVSEVGPAELIYYILSRYKISKSIEIPDIFPAIYYARLQVLGVKITICKDLFFPQRAIKCDDEAQAIRDGNAASAAGIRAAEKVLRMASIEGKLIKYKGCTLTSDSLRQVIDKACLSKGAVANNTIVACGRQACDPHQVGFGPLRANELIIIDVFPRVRQTGYHGDMTRTFLKGVANDAQRSLVKAVREAQLAARERIKAGVSGASVHNAASRVFIERGFATERRGDNYFGFIHSTGHGLGLDVHEYPSVSTSSNRLRSGHVITVEPGLYYPEIGACRIEDVIRVTAKGGELLSSMHYRWCFR